MNPPTVKTNVLAATTRVFTHPTLTIVQKWTYWRTGSLPRAPIVKTRGEAPVNVESRGILIELIRPGVHVNSLWDDSKGRRWNSEFWGLGTDEVTPEKTVEMEAENR